MNQKELRTIYKIMMGEENEKLIEIYLEDLIRKKMRNYFSIQEKSEVKSP